MSGPEEDLSTALERDFAAAFEGAEAAGTGAETDRVLRSVMVVDDQPANLKLLEEILKERGYELRFFPRGRLALDAAILDPPDLVLLDIRMPEMDGFEVCENLKADPKLAQIPVIFLSALTDVNEKAKAFRCGGVDYVTKPFQIDEVRARVETHLALYRAREVERELLEKTLRGAISALSGILHLTAPALATRSEALRSMAAHMAAQMRLNDAWQYEIAAMLCLIGCIVVPPDVFDRAYSGGTVTEAEAEMFHGHPEIAFQLLSEIPRLQPIAQMIRLQQTGTADEPVEENVELGSRILKTLLELDGRMLRGDSFKAAHAHLHAVTGCFPETLLDALATYAPPPTLFESKQLKITQLQPGMVLEEALLTKDGRLVVLPEGTTLNFAAIERIRNFAQSRGVREPIQVRVPEGAHISSTPNSHKAGQS